LQHCLRLPVHILHMYILENGCRLQN